MLNHIKNLIIKIIDIFIYILPIFKKEVFFESFQGKYNDNPKFISERLHEKCANVTIVWCVNKYRSDLPEYIVQVKRNTLKYFIHKNLALVSVDNYIGSISHYGKFGGNIIHNLLHSNRKFNISTWHGTPLKKIGADLLVDKNKNGFYSTSDILVSGCEYTKKCLDSSTYNLLNVKALGTPRNDIFFYDNEHINKKNNKLKESMGIPRNKKICLYAPTYRDNVKMSGLDQISQIDVNELLVSLKNKFGGDWVFVFRVHHVVEEKIIEYGLLENKDNVFNGNDVEDMADYLSVTDLLISDYSGSIFDYSLKEDGKCILFVPDQKEYSAYPGLYKPVEFLPYPIAENYEELINCIKQYDEKEVEIKNKHFLIDIGNVEDGKASERISQIIINKLYKRGDLYL